MPYIYDITFDKLLLKRDLGINRLYNDIRDIMSKAMMDFGKTFEQDLKSAAHQAQIQQFTGTIYGQGIRYDQLPHGLTGHLMVYRVYQYLDQMKPHWVAIHRRRTGLLGWASQAINPEIRRGAELIKSRMYKRFAIYVHSHPFIGIGRQRALSKMSPIIRRYVKVNRRIKI